MKKSNQKAGYMTYHVIKVPNLDDKQSKMVQKRDQIQELSKYFADQNLLRYLSFRKKQEEI